jgi:hypothetical protein
MTILETISNACKAIANYFGWAQSRSEAKNQPDVKASAKTQAEVNTRNRIDQHIKNRNTRKTQEEIAE